MNRTGKEQIIKEMQDVISTFTSFYFVDYKGLKVKEISALREKIKESKGAIRVVKNTLLKKATEDTTLKPVEQFLQGPTAIAWSENDPIPLAKTLTSFAKDNPNLKIKGGFVDGSLLSENEVEVLSKLPGINEIRSQIIGMLQAPMSKLIGVLKAPGRNVAVCISERGKQEIKP